MRFELTKIRADKKEEEAGMKEGFGRVKLR
jgi:hypothetical protein